MTLQSLQPQPQRPLQIHFRATTTGWMPRARLPSHHSLLLLVSFFDCTQASGGHSTVKSLLVKIPPSTFATIGCRCVRTDLILGMSDTESVLVVVWFFRWLARGASIGRAHV